MRASNSRTLELAARSADGGATVALRGARGPSHSRAVVRLASFEATLRVVRRLPPSSASPRAPPASVPVPRRYHRARGGQPSEPPVVARCSTRGAATLVSPRGGANGGRRDPADTEPREVACVALQRDTLTRVPRPAFRLRSRCLCSPVVDSVV